MIRDAEWCMCTSSCAWHSVPVSGARAGQEIALRIRSVSAASSGLIRGSTRFARRCANGEARRRLRVDRRTRLERRRLGGLLFSDIPNNSIMFWKEGASSPTCSWTSPATRATPFTGGEPGTNGLAIDSKGRLVMCCHGDRQVVRIEEVSLERTVLASKYRGQRLNSPNDLVFKSNGDLYFTDPPYGLPKGADDPGRELDFCGVYRLFQGGELTLLTEEMTRPNGIAFSPDEKTLYVANPTPTRPIWKAFPVKDDGTLGEGQGLLRRHQMGRKTAGPARRHEGRPGRQHVRDRPRRRFRLPPGRHAPRHASTPAKRPPTAASATTARRSISAPTCTSAGFGWRPRAWGSKFRAVV